MPISQLWKLFWLNWTLRVWIGYSMPGIWYVMALFQNEAIRLLRDRGVTSVYGNRDREIYEFPQKHKKYRANLDPLRFKAYEWTYNSLTAENLDYLRSLPERSFIPVNSHKLLIVHDRPCPQMPQPRTHIPDSDFEEVAANVEEDIIAFGHSHIPFIKEIAGKLFINTGSVGRPFDGDPRAGYALLTIETEQVTAQIKRVRYDIDKTVEAVFKSDLPDEFALMFRQGRKLGDIARLK